VGLRPVGAFVVLLGVAYLLDALPASASNPCEFNGPTLTFNNVPNRIARKRPLFNYASHGDPTTSLTRQGPIYASFEPKEVDGRLKHAFAVQRDEPDDLPPLWFVPRDGPASFQVHWTESDSAGNTCERSSTATIRPIRGDPASIKVGTVQRGTLVLFDDQSCLHDSRAMPGRVTIRVWGLGASRQTHLPDQCDTTWHPSHAYAYRWALVYRQDYRSIALKLRHLQFGTRRLRFRVTFRHHTLVEGRFVFRVRRLPVFGHLHADRVLDSVPSLETSVSVKLAAEAHRGTP
jgi:hypothetical protein